ATITGLDPEKSARIWLPVPPSNEDQDVKIESKELPGSEQISTEPKYGNQVLYVEGKADNQGTVSVAVTYRVRRKEVRGDFQRSASQDAAESFLKPDSRVPVGGKSLDLIRGQELPEDEMEAARALYDIVNHHMRYSKEGTGWGRGDSDWACESGY